MLVTTTSSPNRRTLLQPEYAAPAHDSKQAACAISGQLRRALIEFIRPLLTSLDARLICASSAPFELLSKSWFVSVTEHKAFTERA
jgi:hypothetical protein